MVLILQGIKAPEKFINVATKTPRKLTPEEEAEIDELLEQLKMGEGSININGKKLSFDEIKQKVEEFKNKMRSTPEPSTNSNNDPTAQNDNDSNNENENANEPEPVEQEGGDDILTTKGIVNPNVNCYCISTIQMLYSIPQIRKALLEYVCSFDLSENDIKNVGNSSIKDTMKAKLNSLRQTDKKAKAADTLDGESIICGIKKVFEQLNASTSTFDQLNDKSATDILNSEGKTPVSDVYVKYVMKHYIAMRNLIIEEANQKRKNVDKEPLETLTRQQEATELIDMIMDVFQKDKNLSFIPSLFNFHVNHNYECEDKTYSRNTNISKTTELTLDINVAGYVTNENNPFTTNNVKYVDGKSKYIALDKLLRWRQKGESFAYNETNVSSGIDGCGKDGGRGSGVKSDIIVPTEDNKYLFIKTNRYTFSPNTGERVLDRDIKIFVNPEITVDKNTYHIFGSILYSGLGTSGGHYTYDRFYIKDNQKPTEGSEASDLPFVLYNDERVLFKGDEFNTTNNSYLLVYRLVSKSKNVPSGAAEAEAEADGEGAEGADGEGAEGANENEPTGLDEEPKIERNFYKVFGVDRFTSPTKKQYFKLVKETHPNQGGTKEAAQEVVRAWEVLNNPRLKRVYDNALQEGLSHSEALRRVTELERIIQQQNVNRNEEAQNANQPQPPANEVPPPANEAPPPANEVPPVGQEPQNNQTKRNESVPIVSEPTSPLDLGAKVTEVVPADITKKSNNVLALTNGKPTNNTNNKLVKLRNQLQTLKKSRQEKLPKNRKNYTHANRTKNNRMIASLEKEIKLLENQIATKASTVQTANASTIAKNINTLQAINFNKIENAAPTQAIEPIKAVKQSINILEPQFAIVNAAAKGIKEGKLTKLNTAQQSSIRRILNEFNKPHFATIQTLPKAQFAEAQVITPLKNALQQLVIYEAPKKPQILTIGNNATKNSTSNSTTKKTQTKVKLFENNSNSNSNSSIRNATRSRLTQQPSIRRTSFEPIRPTRRARSNSRNSGISTISNASSTTMTNSNNSRAASPVLNEKPKEKTLFPANLLNITNLTKDKINKLIKILEEYQATLETKQKKPGEYSDDRAKLIQTIPNSTRQLKNAKLIFSNDEKEKIVQGVVNKYKNVKIEGGDRRKTLKKKRN